MLYPGMDVTVWYLAHREPGVVTEAEGPVVRVLTQSGEPFEFHLCAYGWKSATGERLCDERALAGAAR